MEKKIIILCLVVFCAGQTFAEEEVYLDLKTPDVYRINTGSLKYENTKIEHDDDMEYLKPSFGQLKEMFVEDFCNTKKDRNKNNP